MNAQVGNIDQQDIERILAGPFIDEAGTILVDSSKQKAIPITAINSLTKEIKHYMLRVTSKGGICIV